MDITGVILAGGKSSRMGCDKALLQVGGETLLSRSVAELRCSTCVTEVIIVGGQRDNSCLPGLRNVADNYKGLGPLAGIQRGLEAACCEYAFVMACDMPFFQGKLIDLLSAACQGYDAVVPRVNGYTEPLCALYAKTCLPAIEKVIAAKRYKITEFYPLIRVKYLEEEAIRTIAEPVRLFANINTPEDILKYWPAEKVFKKQKKHDNIITPASTKNMREDMHL